MKISKRVLALVLTLIIFATMILPPFYLKVDAAEDPSSVQERQSGFINYWAKADEGILDAKNLSSTEYDTLYVFISNFFKPGVTTLADLQNDKSILITELNSAFGFADPQQFNNVIKQFALDFKTNGIAQGKCTLYYGTSVANGDRFLYALKHKLSSIAENSNYISTLYCKNSDGSNKTVLDFKSEAMMAAFKILFAYNPYLFLNQSGINSMDIFFVDYVGNIWGGKIPTKSNLEEINTSQGIMLQSVELEDTKELESVRENWINGNIQNEKILQYIPDECIYLVLPACLNPITFSPNVTSSDTNGVNSLRFPMMNSFVLPYLMKYDNFKSLNADTEMIPFYNLLVSTDSVVTRLDQRMQIFCVNSLTPFLGHTGGIKGLVGGIYEQDKIDWDARTRRKDFANTLYSSEQVLLVNKNNKGVGRYGSNSYVVLSPRFNPKALGEDFDYSKTIYEGNVILDIRDSGFLGIKSHNIFGVFNEISDNDTVLLYQSELISTLCSPSFLDFNHICMTTYVLSDSLYKDKGDAFEAFSEDITSNELAAKMGMKGLDLFFNSSLGSQLMANGEEYTSFSPSTSTILKSKFIKDLTESEGNLIADSPKKWAEFYDTKLENLSESEQKSAIQSFLQLDDDTLSYLLKSITDSNSYPILSDINGKEIDDLNYKNTDGTETQKLIEIQKFLNYYKKDCTSKNFQDTPISMTYHLIEKMDASVYKYALNFDSNIIGTISMENLNDYWGRMHPLLSHYDSNIFFTNPYKENWSYSQLEGITTTPTWERFKNNTIKHTYYAFPQEKDRVIEASTFVDLFLTEYGYTLIFPSEETVNVFSSNDYLNSNGDGKFWGYSHLKENYTSETFKAVEMPKVSFTNKMNLAMGVYFGYILDIHSIESLTIQNEEENIAADFKPGALNTTFLPVYSISAKGQLSYTGKLDSELSGVIGSSNTSFEKMQEDLIRRIYGITDDKNNDYRNNLIKNIIEGFLITVHRTITGTWGSNVSSVSTGSSSTYQSVTGYIYTPTLEELSFTSSIMDNYVKIYILCMILIIFIAVLMTLLHMRSWQQSLIVCLTMFIALLFPYILISNSINISNKISDSIYSDRFDFWALSDHYASLLTLQSATGMTEKDALLTRLSATSDTTRSGDPGVKIKWMSPKKVELFQNLYSDKSLSDTFVTNMEIFKWLFNSTIYDSEYVDTNAFGNFLYRPYKNIALEATDYYKWGEELFKHLNERVGNSVAISGIGYQFSEIPKLYFESLNQSDDVLKTYLSSFARIENKYYTDTSSYLVYDSQLLSDLERVKGKTENYRASTIGLWGSVDGSNISQKIFKTTDFSLQGQDYGITSNLPSEVGRTTPPASLTESPEKLSRAIFLKNTESPYYYFYSVLKYRYKDGSSENSFKKALLDKSTFKISAEESKDISWNDTRNVTNKFRDYLDMEGLFTYMIPYLHDANTYVINWQAVNGSEIVQYDFRYEVDADGNPINIGVIDGDKDHPETQKPENVGYEEAVRQKNQMNKIWNMYCPWVDSLYALRKSSETVSVGGKKIYIQDTLNPSSYLQNGRPMIFSEADMILRGYKYKDLTDIERRIQAVLENTYTDLMYLVNYYDMDEEVLLSAAAMYATFNFNREFSQNSLFGTSIMLYPQGFELRNFNYDAYMRLALLNSTGESVYDTSDLFTRVMSKTSIFTGLLLLVCDVVACIAIPMFKFVILVGLLFLGVLICLVCVVNPPEKIFEAVCKSLLLPTVLFMVLNIGFAWVMSFVVGEGLTSYVGSKTINFATNDPTITILIMALLGVAYIYFAWKILKFLISAYKQFGMSTALATVGIVGAAFAGLSKKVMHTAGGILGDGAGAVGAGASAAYGLATGEKGHRLEDAKDAMRYGVGGLNDRRRAEKRQADREKEVSDASTDRIVDAINQKASTPNESGSVPEEKGNTSSEESNGLKDKENKKSIIGDKNINDARENKNTNDMSGFKSGNTLNKWDLEASAKFAPKKEKDVKKNTESLTESNDSRKLKENNGKSKSEMNSSDVPRRRNQKSGIANSKASQTSNSLGGQIGSKVGEKVGEKVEEKIIGRPTGNSKSSGGNSKY